MTTITLELPQNIYEPLQKAAAKAGQSPQELITNLHSAGYLGQKIIMAGGSAKKPQN